MDDRGYHPKSSTRALGSGEQIKAESMINPGSFILPFLTVWLKPGAKVCLIWVIRKTIISNVYDTFH